VKVWLQKAQGGGGEREGFFTEKILSLSIWLDDVFKQIFSKWRKEKRRKKSKVVRRPPPSFCECLIHRRPAETKRETPFITKRETPFITKRETPFIRFHTSLWRPPLLAPPPSGVPCISYILLCICVFVYFPPTHRTELLEGYPPVSVFVCVDDGFVDDLLQLGVLQVVPHHHLEDLEELPVGDVAVLVHVVDPEGDWRRRGETSRE